MLDLHPEHMDCGYRGRERQARKVKNLPYVDGFNIFFYTGKVEASSPGLLRAPYLF